MTSSGNRMTQASAPGDFLEWDSQFFGKRIGSLRGNTMTTEGMEQALQWASELALDCVYFLVNTDDPETIRVAERNGFYFQSVRTVVERSLVNLESVILPPMDGLTLRISRVDDLDFLRPVARHAYNWTRFAIDPCFPDEKSEEMYDIWLTKSVNHEMADEVIVAEYEGQAVGYVTCRLAKDSSGEGTIQLLGVNEENRGLKIGQRVVVESMLWLAKQGMTKVSLATQGHNVPVIRFYERLGFTTRSIQFWYHKWFTDCNAEQA
jgi:dTDP-4-amino-4,6-dideoxy-D-galactose acyltransferase